MPLGEDSVIVQVVLPKEYIAQLDGMQSPTLRSRSAVIRRIVEATIEGTFSLPLRSVGKTTVAPCDQEAA